VELNPGDARDLGIAEGDLVRVESPRGAIEVRARLGQVRNGCVFAPFHYGTWDLDGSYSRDGDETSKSDRPVRQANELTMTVWDPVSKQPYFKTAACRVTLISAGDGPAPAPTTTASAPAAADLPLTSGGDATMSSYPPTPGYPNDPATSWER